jgi:site-specific DNA recombinase
MKVTSEVRVIAYIRVSRTRGRSGQSFISPGQQRTAIERMAEAKGLTIIKWFDELNESGGNGRRPLWNRAVEMCERGEADGIAVLNLSRFSRSTIDALTMIERIEASGGTLYSASEDFDTSTSAGKAMRTMLFAAAQMERDNAVERNHLNRSNAVARGVGMGRVPFGYLRDKVTKCFVLDAETAWIVVEIFERRVRRESLNETMKWLRSIGHPMGRTTVRDLTENEAYLGISRSGPYRNEDAHDAIVTRELFARAQAVQNLPPNRTGALSNIAMLKSLVYCASCGSRMPPTWTQGARGPDGKRAKLAAYACTGRSKDGCTSTGYIRVDALDSFIDALVLAMLAGGTGPLAEAVTKNERVTETAEAEYAERQILSQLLTNTTLRNVLDVSEFAEMVAGQKARVEMRQADSANAQAQAEMLGSFEGSLAEAWPTLTAMEKRQIVSGFIGQITVKPAHGKRGIAVEQRIQIVDRRRVLIDASMARRYIEEQL